MVDFALRDPKGSLPTCHKKGYLIHFEALPSNCMPRCMVFTHMLNVLNALQRLSRYVGLPEEVQNVMETLSLVADHWIEWMSSSSLHVQT